jgi:hypothetical protein
MQGLGVLFQNYYLPVLLFADDTVLIWSNPDDLRLALNGGSSTVSSGN